MQQGYRWGRMDCVNNGSCHRAEVRSRLHFLRQILMFYVHQHNSSPTRIERSIDFNPVYFVPALYSSFYSMSMSKTNP